MLDNEILSKLGRLRDLVDDLCSPGEKSTANMRSALLELRQVRKLARELEQEILNRILANVGDCHA